MAARFEVKKAKDGQFYFNLQAANGEIILSSELYKAKSGAEKGIDSVRQNAPLDDRYEKIVNAKGQHFFVLMAKNGEVIGKSETYSSIAAMEK